MPLVQAQNKESEAIEPSAGVLDAVWMCRNFLWARSKKKLQKKIKHYSTQYSHVVTDHSTD